MTSIGVIIPTTGRASVMHAIESVWPQLGPDDRLFVVWDAPREAGPLGDLVALYADNVQVGIAGTGEPSRGGFGHPARNWLLDAEPLARNFTHAWSLDDDDIAHPGALDAIHALIDLHEPTAPERWFAFQMTFGPNSHAAGHTVWREERVALGNIGTPCIVMPTSAKSRWGTMGTDPRTGWSYGAGYFGDYELARDLEAELGPPVWVPHVVCEVRPAAIASDA